ncbi:hypothetical protein Hypma_011026 [Hypsizygus marmoreus]|uniref:WSC domain-containing protein n=1 Tax=Hypsizygus marmoreus TaxID=39966 RepID=A0A369JLE8_HYPMA|nr:hypothetical protein Hypma_011026 [Hypsizygus marmoreus]
MTILQPLSLALAFTLIHLTQASSNHIHSSHTFRHRRQSVPSVLPSPWTSRGCYTDNVGARTLGGSTFADGTGMTTAACISYCDSKGSNAVSLLCFSPSQSTINLSIPYALDCGNSLSLGSTAPIGECNAACSGNSLESCGAAGRLNVYWSGKQPPPPPTAPATIGDWKSLGCYSDNVNGAGRTLTVGAPGVQGDLTLQKCTTACFNAGYPLAGTEYSAECYCGTSIANGGASRPIAECNMVCAGNSGQLCGGPNRLNVYNYTGAALPPQQPGGGGGGGGGGGSPVSPVTSGLPGNWTYDACWVDNAFGRIFPTAIGPSDTNTVQTCIASCSAQNYTLAGMEFGTECYCGKTLIAGAVKGDEATCNVGCAGNATQACGGANRLSVYTSTGNVTALPVPVPLKENLPGKWAYQGCLRETPGTARLLPNKINWPTNNTALACMNQCALFGFPVSGTEYGEECYCGDAEDITGGGAVMGAESECSLPCPGDPLHLCGAGDRLSLYSWNGTMNVWHKPANIGRYEFFVPGVVIPLISTLGINNKITFLEKAGTGFPNSTGAYELDLSLVSNFSAAYREMHVKSDVFCAGSVILPDKAGRQINVGGWSLDSTFGLRLFTPDGVPGTNGTNDWEEDYPSLRLQRGRWYPTAAMLANGSVLVIGGETGSNAPAQPNLEIVPKPVGGDTVKELDWLLRTDPNNLYPHVFILPSTRIFIGYWNEARILDPVTFDTAKVLPNIPGSVTNFLSGRTYPLAGDNCAAMLLPQHAPYSAPVEVLLCGGSTEGAGEAVDNCVTIAPEAQNPTWTIERMPSRRVMACMQNLPDGTYFIANGAHQGVAGFGLAENPNLDALLYDPSRPLGQRISILNTTIVARLYHSELTLLPDGRIMISGSDPQHYNPDGTEKYPEEFRVEVYVPPYLNQGLRQPEFNLSNTDWAYGGQYQITNVKLFQGTTANLRVSLISASSSTHGTNMGARTIFPAFTCTGTSCRITAPPNAGVSPPGWHQLFILDGPTPSHSRWVRIGGDPAKLGNWPDLPGFTRPGI